MTKIKGFIDGFKEGQKNFGESIAVIINSVLLSIVYFVGVGLTSIIAKLLGRNFLGLEFKEGTYWEDLNLGKKERKEYYRQF